MRTTHGLQNLATTPMRLSVRSVSISPIADRPGYFRLTYGGCLPSNYSAMIYPNQGSRVPFLALWNKVCHHVLPVLRVSATQFADKTGLATDRLTQYSSGPPHLPITNTRPSVSQPPESDSLARSGSHSLGRGNVFTFGYSSRRRIFHSTGVHSVTDMIWVFINLGLC